MEYEFVSKPTEPVVDLTHLELCDKCKAALLGKLMKMVMEAEIDNPWDQEDLDRFNHENN